MALEAKVLAGLIALVLALVVLLGVLLHNYEGTCEVVGWTVKGEAVYQCYDPTLTPSPLAGEEGAK